MNKDFWTQYWQKAFPTLTPPKYQHFDKVMVNFNEPPDPDGFDDVCEIEILGVFRFRKEWRYTFYNPDLDKPNEIKEHQIKELTERRNQEIVNLSDDDWTNYWLSKNITDLPSFKYNQQICRLGDLNNSFRVIGIAFDEEDGYLYSLNGNNNIVDCSVIPECFCDETWETGEFLEDYLESLWKAYWNSRPNSFTISPPKYQLKEWVLFRDNPYQINGIILFNVNWHYWLSSGQESTAPIIETDLKKR